MTQTEWTRFCGYELRSDGEEGYYLSQEGYVRDLAEQEEDRRKRDGTLPEDSGR